jgi:glycosyltransferase involved in cell wall biosynthesis
VANVGEIILRDMFQSYTQNELRCYAIVPEGYKPKPAPWVDGSLVKIKTHPGISRRRILPGKWGALTAAAANEILFFPNLKQWVSAGVDFGREHQATKVLMILDSSVNIGIGSAIADSLEIPLLLLVWDAPEYFLLKEKVDRITRTKLLKRFYKTLRKAERVAVASRAMDLRYQQECGIETLILRQGFPLSAPHDAITCHTSPSEFTIGFAGTLYAEAAWRALLGALDQVGWVLEGRRIIIRLLGPDFRLQSNSSAHMEYLGWRSQEESVRILSLCDINYLPYPFEPWLKDAALYSFPVKLSTYLLTGRPVFIHAPAYSSLSEFFHENPIGCLCESLNPDQILGALRTLVADPSEYARAAECAAATARREFNRDEFARQLFKLVGVNPSLVVAEGADGEAQAVENRDS